MDVVKPEILGCIFARGGSKGVPGKNIRPLGGVPLIGHAIRTALASRWLNRIVVSTDCPEIARVAREYGAETPFLRPAALASDNAPERLAWRHAIEQMEAMDGKTFDYFVSVPATCPLRIADDVDRAIEALTQTDSDIVVTATEASCNPWFNMVRLDADGLAQLAATPPGKVTRRQDAPAVYELTAVAYAARRDSVMLQDSIFQGRVRAVMVPRERAVDIDTEFDFELAEFLMQRRLSLQAKQISRHAA